MAKSIDKFSTYPTLQFIYGKRVSHSICLEPTTEKEIVNIIKDLNPNKAQGMMVYLQNLSRQLHSRYLLF